jgi:hypothetical protein
MTPTNTNSKKPLAKKPLTPSGKKPNFNLKMAAPKPKEAKPAKEKKTKEPKAPRPPRRSVRSVAMDLIYEQKHTDAEMIEKIKKEFPDKAINVNIIGACRSEINAGKRVHPTLGKPDGRVEQIVLIDNKRVKRSEKPTPQKKAKAISANREATKATLGKLGIESKKPERKAAAVRKT